MSPPGRWIVPLLAKEIPCFISANTACNPIDSQLLNRNNYSYFNVSLKQNFEEVVYFIGWPDPNIRHVIWIADKHNSIRARFNSNQTSCSTRLEDLISGSVIRVKGSSFRISDCYDPPRIELYVHDFFRFPGDPCSRNVQDFTPADETSSMKKILAICLSKQSAVCDNMHDNMQEVKSFSGVDMEKGIENDSLSDVEPFQSQFLTQVPFAQTVHTERQPLAEVDNVRCGKHNLLDLLKSDTVKQVPPTHYYRPEKPPADLVDDVLAEDLEQQHLANASSSKLQDIIDTRQGQDGNPFQSSGTLQCVQLGKSPGHISDNEMCQPDIWERNDLSSEQKLPSDLKKPKIVPLLQRLRSLRAQEKPLGRKFHLRWSSCISKSQARALETEEAWQPPLPGKTLRLGTVPLDILERLTLQADMQTKRIPTPTLVTTPGDKKSEPESLRSGDVENEAAASIEKSTVHFRHTEKDGEESDEDFASQWSSSPPRPMMPRYPLDSPPQQAGTKVPLLATLIPTDVNSAGSAIVDEHVQISHDVRHEFQEQEQCDNVAASSHVLKDNNRKSVQEEEELGTERGNLSGQPVDKSTIHAVSFDAPPSDGHNHRMIFPPCQTPAMQLNETRDARCRYSGTADKPVDINIEKNQHKIRPTIASTHEGLEGTTSVSQQRNQIEDDMTKVATDASELPFKMNLIDTNPPTSRISHWVASQVSSTTNPEASNSCTVVNVSSQRGSCESSENSMQLKRNISSSTLQKSQLMSKRRKIGLNMEDETSPYHDTCLSSKQRHKFYNESPRQSVPDDETSKPLSVSSPMRGHPRLADTNDPAILQCREQACEQTKQQHEREKCVQREILGSSPDVPLKVSQLHLKEQVHRFDLMPLEHYGLNAAHKGTDENDMQEQSRSAENYAGNVHEAKPPAPTPIRSSSFNAQVSSNATRSWSESCVSEDSVKDLEVGTPHTDPTLNSLVVQQTPCPPGSNESMIFKNFQSTYPNYKGELKHFIAACRILKKLQATSSRLHPSLFDDFINRHNHEYGMYLKEMIEEGGNALPYEIFYYERIEMPRYFGRVIRTENLNSIDCESTFTQLSVVTDGTPPTSSPLITCSVGLIATENSFQPQAVLNGTKAKPATKQGLLTANTALEYPNLNVHDSDRSCDSSPISLPVRASGEASPELGASATDKLNKVVKLDLDASPKVTLTPPCHIASNSKQFAKFAERYSRLPGEHEAASRKQIIDIFSW